MDSARPGASRRSWLWIAGLGLGSALGSCLIVYLFVDPGPAYLEDEEAAAEAQLDGDPEDGPEGRSGLGLVKGERIRGAGASADFTLRAPAVGKLRGSRGGGGRNRNAAADRDWPAPPDAAPEAAPKAKDRPKAGPLNRLSATLHSMAGGLRAALTGGGAGDSGEASARTGRLFASVLTTGPRSAVAAAKPVAAQQAVKSSRSGLAFAPIGPQGAGALPADAKGNPSQVFAPQAAGAPSGGAGAGAGFGAATVTGGPAQQASESGGVWGATQQGGEEAHNTTTLTKIKSYDGLVFGLDLATLYKKLKALGVTEAQFKLLEDCLVGQQGCTGGDIWEACTKAAIFNACANVCREVPGCVVPGSGGTGTTSTTCTPEPGCLPSGTMIEVESCGDLALIWSLPNQTCCSCGTSCYSTADASPTYGNTGVNCHSSCPAGHYIHRFCSD
ncbi:MAG: hypothetical protein HY553_21250 [Elusimicrobia bacterium]|nr:hypothetical protein [Elusimicrobiota bacterium]